MLNPDGTVSRPKLAEVVFGKPKQSVPSRIEELNRIVHPAVIRRQEEWMDEIEDQNHGAVAIVEAALILEAGAGKRFDRLIVVTCRPEQRIQRFTDRMKLDEQTARQEIRRRMSAQLPDQEKIKAADYVIDNSGSLDVTEEQVRDIYGRLKGQAERDR
ncbi:MAG: dephospho-CoA kinase [Acidobacteria bacterium]|nr:MAG: dephospho-CoA kinase [Acidobacteriota bacterium]